MRPTALRFFSRCFATELIAASVVWALFMGGPSSFVGAADRVSPAAPRIAGWFKRFPSLFPLRSRRSAAAPVTPAAPVAKASANAPYSLVHVHISAEVLAREALRSVDKQLPVRDVILGVPVQGQARLTATTRLNLLEDQEKGVFELVLTGSAVSTTRANAGRATIHSRTVTSFTATKKVVLDQQGFHAQPATCRAVAHSTITGVSSPLPRLRGRLARRVAWRRAQSQRAQAEVISARHSEQSIGRSFDADIARDLRQANAWLADRLKNSTVAGNPLQPRFRTSVDRLRVTGLTGNPTDLAAVQEKLKEFELALGLLFENDHLVLTVGVPPTKRDGLAGSQSPATVRAARLLKPSPRR